MSNCGGFRNLPHGRYSGYNGNQLGYLLLKVGSSLEDTVVSHFHSVSCERGRASLPGVSEFGCHFVLGSFDFPLFSVGRAA